MTFVFWYIMLNLNWECRVTERRGIPGGIDRSHAACCSLLNWYKEQEVLCEAFRTESFEPSGFNLRMSQLAAAPTLPNLRNTFFLCQFIKKLGRASTRLFASWQWESHISAKQFTGHGHFYICGVIQLPNNAVELSRVIDSLLEMSQRCPASSVWEGTELGLYSDLCLDKYWHG